MYIYIYICIYIYIYIYIYPQASIQLLLPTAVFPQIFKLKFRSPDCRMHFRHSF